MVILSNTQYFQGVDTAYTKQHAVFSLVRHCTYKAIHSYFGGGYCLDKAIRIIFLVMILFIQTIGIIFGGLILVLLSDAQYYRRLAVFS